MSRLVSYANVTSTLALVLALSGGAYAATKLPKNSVGTKQIRTGAVHSVDIATNGVTAVKVAPNAIGSAKIAPNSIGSAKIADRGIAASDLALGLRPVQSGGGQKSSTFVTPCTAPAIITQTVTPVQRSRIFVTGDGVWYRNTGSNTDTVSFELTPLIQVRPQGGSLLGSARGGLTRSSATDGYFQSYSVSGLALGGNGYPAVLEPGTKYDVSLVVQLSGQCTGNPYVSSAEMSFLLVPDNS